MSKRTIYNSENKENKNINDGLLVIAMLSSEEGK